MSRFERDLIKRQIQQLGEAVAAILLRARAEHDYESGLEAVRLRAQEGLGVDYAMLSRLAPASAAMLLRDGEVIQTYARICAGEATLEQAAGREAAAQALRRRALELFIDAALRDRSLEAECRRQVAELGLSTERAGLAPAYGAWLDLAP